MTTPLLITSIVFDYFNVPIEDRDNRSRNHEKVIACQFSMYFLRKYTKYSQAAVGRIFCKDHATVLHSCQKIENESAIYSDTRRDISNIIDRIIAGIITDDYVPSYYDTDNV